MRTENYRSCIVLERAVLGSGSMGSVFVLLTAKVRSHRDSVIHSTSKRCLVFRFSVYNDGLCCNYFSNTRVKAMALRADMHNYARLPEYIPCILAAHLQPASYKNKGAILTSVC